MKNGDPLLVLKATTRSVIRGAFGRFAGVAGI